MKTFLRQAEASVRTGVHRVRSWFDPPLTADARPLEIREAIIEDVEQRVEPAGQGRRVLPHNHLSITILAADRDDRARVLAALTDLREAICGRLREIRCQVPAGFEVELDVARRARPGWTPDQRFEIRYSSRDAGHETRAVRPERPGAKPGHRASTARTPDPAGTSEAGASKPLDPPVIHITVIRGAATQPSYELADVSVRIGRSVTAIDSRGRSRKNQVAFVEDGDEHSATVGRAHATIRFDRDRREYRLFDDGSRNGTRVVRGSNTVEVLPRDPVGVTIVSGDEIELGTAALKVEIG